MLETLVVLLAFIAFAALFERLRLGTVPGFLIGGAVIGPFGLGVVAHLEAVHVLAELGIVFLLFTLGLELKLERLRLVGARVFVLAFAQLALTAGAVAALGRGLGLDLEAALIVGGALALSSTAVVLQVLRDLGRTLTVMGRTAIAILLVQDVAVGPLIVMAKALGGAGDSIAITLLVALAKGVVVVVGVVAASRFLLRPALGAIALIKADEVFAAAALLLVLAASWATEQAGLSMALGAFVAGLMVADTEYRHQIAADIGPFRGLLLGLFFMSVGMTVDPRFALGHAGAIVAAALGLIVLKAAILGGLARALRLPPLRSIELGLLLAQGSEFAFVLFALAVATGLLDDPMAQLLTVAVALSMGLTSVGANLGRGLLNRLEGEPVASLGDLDAGTAAARNHVLVIGFGQVGMALTRHLVGLGVPVLALDYDPRRVRASRARGLPVYFGNAVRPDVLRATHVGRARLAVIALPDPINGARVVGSLRQMHPELRLLARAPDGEHAARLRAAGANAVVVDGLTTALDLAQRAVLLYEPEEMAASATPATERAD